MSNQQPPITYHPLNGTRLAEGPCGVELARRLYPTAWPYNPWTGTKRVSHNVFADPLCLAAWEATWSEPPPAAAALKPTNPKDAIGSGKLPLHLWPETASALGCLGLLDGMLKYGRSNWRSAGVRASIYVDAAKRHLNRWFEGEDIDPDSGLPHLAHALACLAILVDAKAAGKLNDDRQVRGGYHAMLADLTPHVDRLKKLHADKAPRHFTIADNE